MPSFPLFPLSCRSASEWFGSCTSDRANRSGFVQRRLLSSSEFPVQVLLPVCLECDEKA